MKYPVYLDNHSTTMIDKSVLDAMLPYLTEMYGNPSSKSHPYGWTAEQAVENARQIIAAFFNCENSEIIFTSGTTEANHIAISGVLEKEQRKHIITAQTEHSSVLNLLRYYESRGVRITYLPVNNYGQIDLDQLNDSISGDTVLVTLMSANNEIGTLHPLSEIGGICRTRNVLFHTDAAQAVGKIRIDVSEFNIDMLSFSGHKNHGPKGIGALYVNRKVKLKPVYFGGGQEKSLRPGTLNVPGIAGLGKSIEISASRLPDEYAILRSLRDKFYNNLVAGINDLKLNGHPDNRLPNNLNISIPNITNPDMLLMELRELAFSTGAACSSGSSELSHVLKATGLADNLIRSSLRFSIGRFTTKEDIDFASERVISAVKKIWNTQLSTQI